MYSVNRIYDFIMDDLSVSVNSNDYDNIDDYYEALNNQEEALERDILCNNDFDTYGEEGRMILAEITGKIYGWNYEALSRVLTDEGIALEVIWENFFDEVVNILCNEFEIKLQYDEEEEE